MYSNGSSQPSGNNTAGEIMIPKRVLRSFRIVLAALILSPFVFGEEPQLPPYHQYLLVGELSRSNAGPKENFVVTLVGQFSTPFPDTTLELLPPLAFFESDAIWSVTDTSGKFMIDVKSEFKADSIAIKVTAVDKPDYVGSSFFVPQPGTTIMGEHKRSGSGCNGCNNVEPTQSYVKGYRYQFPYQVVLVPL